MIKKLLIVSACVLGVGGAAGAAQVETWRMVPELIQDWSLFHCVRPPPDRFWHFTLEDSQLTAVGPEGATYTATVAKNGSFKAKFNGTYSRPGTDSTMYFLAEVSGNLKEKWIHQHNVTTDCWFKLVPK
jgi:hypothetical protein